jgi:hypothetical protein
LKPLVQTSTQFVRGLLDRLVLVSAVVAGGLVPGFIAQYRQRLGGRLDQARMDLASWQQIADRYFHGDLNRLIQYHLSSNDPTFRAEGSVIRSLVVTVQHLQDAMSALQGSLLQQTHYLVLHGDVGLARATLADWVPTFALTLEGIAFALALGAVLWCLFHVVWWLISWPLRALFGTRPLSGAAPRR